MSKINTDLILQKVNNPRLYILFSDKIREFYENKIKDLEEYNLKQSWARVLHFIGDFEGLSQQDLCDFFNLRPSTVSGMLTELERQGFIARTINPLNRRRVCISLTEKGKLVSSEIYCAFTEYCNKTMKNFTPEECATFEKLLQKFIS